MTPHNFNPVSIIRKKRDGNKLSDREIKFIIDEYTKDALPDYQMSAFLMSVVLRGLDDEETAALTEAMLYSGKVLDLSDIPGKKVDKHSTGGVGDKLSLILAPIVASCGVPVPMISGRGLGHTGGTLDKLESITGFNVDITLDRYREILMKHHLVMAGATEDIAPADKRLYALRDVTATIESIPLIAGSIMSKKLAGGIDALVLDVKFGSGAFMNSIADAKKLAHALVAIGERFGKETIAYLTNMDQPLGYKIGNWLEVEEAIDALKGKGPKDVMEITHRLAGTMICLGGKADSIEEGISKSKQAVHNGNALTKWISLVEEQGGDASLINDPGSYPDTMYQFECNSKHEGFVEAINAYEAGMASLELGAGRRKKEDTINPAAGVVLKKKIGDTVKEGETIVLGYTNNSRAIEPVRQQLIRAISIGAEQPKSQGLIKYKVDKLGVHELKS